MQEVQVHNLIEQKNTWLDLAWSPIHPKKRDNKKSEGGIGRLNKTWKRSVKQLTIIGGVTGFELSISEISIIAMPKKSHFTIFAIQNLVENTQKTRIPFILLESCL